MESSSSSSTMCMKTEGEEALCDFIKGSESLDFENYHNIFQKLMLRFRLVCYALK